MVIEKHKWGCVLDPSKTARTLLARAYGDKPYHEWQDLFGSHAERTLGRILQNTWDI